MTVLEAGLLSIGCGLIYLIGAAVVVVHNSRKIQYLEEQQMSQEQELQDAIGGVKTAFEGYKSRQDAAIAALEEKNASSEIDLTDEIAELKSIGDSMSSTVETLPTPGDATATDTSTPNADTAPVAEESPAASDSGPVSDAAPDVSGTDTPAADVSGTDASGV